MISASFLFNDGKIYSLQSGLNQISTNSRHFPRERSRTIASAAILPVFLVHPIPGKCTHLPGIQGTFPPPPSKILIPATEGLSGVITKHASKHENMSLCQCK